MIGQSDRPVLHGFVTGRQARNSRVFGTAREVGWGAPEPLQTAAQGSCGRGRCRRPGSLWSHPCTAWPAGQAHQGKWVALERTRRPSPTAAPPPAVQVTHRLVGSGDRPQAGSEASPPALQEDAQGAKQAGQGTPPRTRVTLSVAMELPCSQRSEGGLSPLCAPGLGRESSPALTGFELTAWMTWAPAGRPAMPGPEARRPSWQRCIRCTGGTRLRQGRQWRGWPGAPPLRRQLSTPPRASYGHLKWRVA